MRRRAGNERGQSLVEFALIIPIVLLLMLGLFDIGRVVFTNNSLSDGARHGARHAATDPEAVDYCSRVDAAVRSATLGQPLTTFVVTYVTVDPSGTETGDYVLCEDGANGPDFGGLPITAQPGDRVTVELESDMTLATPLVAIATRQETFNLQAQSTMQVTFVPAEP